MKKIFYILFVLLIAACSSSPLDKKYNEKTVEEDMKSIADAKALDSSESVLIVKYLMRAKLKGESLEGKTYKEILAAAKVETTSKTEEETENDNANNDEGKENFTLEEMVGDEQKAKVAKLKAALDVNFVDKTLFGKDKLRQISYEFTFKNNSAKEIKAVNGDAVFSDLEGNEIKVITLKYDGAIKPNETIKFASSVDYNEKDVEINSKKKVQLVMNWNPKDITYSDGTAVE